uniref:Si:dkey-13n15.2 n=1 Tax=Tetraodon nigroviridis TaxID=99883 RepID=H3DDV9_TETNG
PTWASRYGLNPELLPSAVKVCAEDQAEWEEKVFVSEPFSHLPPLATTSCRIEDGGRNASPLAIRCTTYCAPCDGQAALLSRLPLGALVTPLAKRNPGEKPLQVCVEPECMKGCGWCGASMCPAMGWLDCGQRFHCPFCDKLTEVPWQHYQPTSGVGGPRVDKDRRPELHLGSYEILSSQKGVPAALILAIDVSGPALRGGHLEFLTQQLLHLLASLKREDGEAWSDVRVGLMTYDGQVHLYDLSPALSRPHMLVLTDAQDLQLPVREGLLAPLRDCMDGLSSVLQLLPHFSPDCEGSGSVELPVKAGLAVLRELSCPGKLLVFHAAPLVETSPSNASSGFFGSNKPKSIFQPSDGALSLAKDCVSQGCGVHVFVLSQQDVGGAWPGHLPYLTGGALHTYSQLQGELDRERFSSDLRRTVARDTAYMANLRIFVSRDLRVSGCYGLFIPGSDPGRVTMATMDQFTSQAVELAHSRGLDETRGLTLQAVLSYSTQSGDRRTRVHTLTLRCSRHLRDVFRQYQAQTLLTFYCKKIYCAVLERPLQELREELQTDVTEALASYRKHSAPASAGQLVLPQHLRALPVYINSLRKSDVLLPGLRTSVHQRLQQRCQVLGMDTLCTSTHFYPLLLPLLRAADPPEAEEPLRCSASSLKPTAVYLVRRLALLLWVGAQVPADSLVQLFNTSCFFSLSSGETRLPVLQNPLSLSVRSLIDRLNSQVPCTRKLWLIKQGDACEEALQRHLVEDKSPNGGASYADFLYHLHVNSVRLLH